MTESAFRRLEVALRSLGIIVRSTRGGRETKRSGGFQGPGFWARLGSLFGTQVGPKSASDRFKTVLETIFFQKC